MVVGFLGVGFLFVFRWGVVGALGLGGCTSGSNRLMTSRSGQPSGNRFPVCGRPITSGQFWVYRSIIPIPSGRPITNGQFWVYLSIIPIPCLWTSNNQWAVLGVPIYNTDSLSVDVQ